ncbi:MAG TPA: phosphoenolpyruvate carboxylase [Actinomycetota bacterium]|nr:phosphoenolpyruvate carboxylase [Actinomycetota bacterium]
MRSDPAVVETEVPPAPAALRRDVRLLSTILGRVLVETEGPELLDDVERLRRAAIALRRAPGAGRRVRVLRVVRSFDAVRAEQVARAFTCYFQLANLAEERHRVRELLARSHGPEPLEESIESAVAELRARGHEDVSSAIRNLDVMPVITAHPTEARRRTTLETLWRIGDLLARMDDPFLAPAERQDVERRLFEEVTVLWRADPVRSHRPHPLDEVRAVMALFDQTIFRLLPALCREIDRTAAPGFGARPPVFEGVPVRWGSWVGGDRDGHTEVTAEITEHAARIASEHVLLGLEAATRRIARTLSVADADVPPARALVRSIERDAALLPRVAAELRRKLPGMSHRLKLGFCAHRLAATRARANAGYEHPADFLEDLRAVQRSLEAAGVARLAFGELQHLVWQVEAFGFHLAELEVRQHSEVVTAAAKQHRRRPAAASRELRETLETFRSMREIQRMFGANACHRFVVSFTRDASDVAAVHRLASAAVKDRGFELDVVPLFETRAHLDRIVETCDAIVGLPPVRRRLARRGAVFEVMLGYSDSAKGSGVLAANVALYRAQVELVAWAERRGIALRIFHGRGGALGRGGGPTNRAIMGQPAGSVRGRFKVTEQGEVAFSRYGDPALARRHLEQIVHALLIASTPEHEAEARGCWERFGQLMVRMAEDSEECWRGLVERPGFVGFFGRATPMREIEGLAIGSRPSRRRATVSLDDVRAIPWVFAWGQARVGLPGWYGVGSALESVARDPNGLKRLREMHRRWAFFSSLLENVQLSLAKADRQVAQSYLESAGDETIAAAILDELDRTLDLVLQVSEQDALLAHRPVLRRAIELRNPYVDALSLLQLRFLPEARAGDPQAGRIVAITVSGVAAGLQNTG